MKKIEIIVSTTGETRLETKGFAGAECREFSSSLERSLGLVRSDRPTAEYHAVDQSVRSRTREPNQN